MDDRSVSEICPQRTVLWFEVILCVGAVESPARRGELRPARGGLRARWGQGAGSRRGDEGYTLTVVWSP